MKNQYVGDVGDFGKYALLRAFAEAGIRVGVNWYLTEDDGSNDGKFTNYLNDENMRNHSPEVFDVLRKLVKKSKKSVIDIQKSGIIKDALFYAKLLKTEGTPVQRTSLRNNWFRKSEKALSDTELIFMDPDNGLLVCNDAAKLGAEKYILPDEAEQYFRNGHNVVYYCHKGRRTAKLWQEYKSLMLERIPEAKPIILTFRKGSQRSYVFLIHQKDFKRYQKIIDGFLQGWSPIFTEETM